MIASRVYNWLKNNLSQSCMLCLSRTRLNHHGICDGCLGELPWLLHACRQCALPLDGMADLCGQCLSRPPAFSRSLAVFSYRFPVDRLIVAFKHHDQLGYGRLLAGQLLEQVRHADRQLHPLPDLLLPMPLHPRRQARRGFNQALELCRPLAAGLDIPLAHNLLLRTRNTRTQQTLNASERQLNLHGAFHCPQPEKIAGLHLALVDDVMTTGTSADEAARTLIQAGAAGVSIWCVARTPEQQANR